MVTASAGLEATPGITTGISNDTPNEPSSTTRQNTNVDAGAIETSPNAENQEVDRVIVREITIQIPFFGSPRHSQSWMGFICSIVKNMCSLAVNLFMYTFTNNITTKQLHIMSTALLSIHFLVTKLLEFLPFMLIKIFNLLGDQTIYIDDIFSQLNIYKSHDSKWLTAEIETLEKIFEEIVMDGVGSGTGFGHLSGRSKHPSVSTEKMITFFETPITSIMLPTTILSVFLLMTMTMFLVFHILFQGFIHMTSLMTENSSGGLSNSPTVMAAIMFLLILENVLPWILFATGLYLSFSIGGLMWCAFTATTFIVYIALRGVRTLVYTRFQDGEFQDD